MDINSYDTAQNSVIYDITQWGVKNVPYSILVSIVEMWILSTLIINKF